MEKHEPERSGAALVRLVLVWAAMIALAAGAGYLLEGRLTPSRLRDWVQQAGNVGPVLFLLFSLLAPLIFIPVAPVTVAAALLFSWPWSLLLMVLSRNGSANLGYWLARRLGPARVAKLLGSGFDQYTTQLRRRGITTVILFRALPLAPFTGVSFAAAFAGIRWRDYALGSFLGMLPGSAVSLGALSLLFG